MTSEPATVYRKDLSTSTGSEGPSRIDGIARLIDSARTTAEGPPRPSSTVAALERSDWTCTSQQDPGPYRARDSITIPLANASRAAGSFQNLSLQQHALEQLSMPCPVFAGNLHEHGVAAPFLGNDFAPMRAPCMTRSGFASRFVDLVERDEYRVRCPLWRARSLPVSAA
jgi:hypothetical protein